MIHAAAITEWRAEHPWLDDAQVEQDLEPISKIEKSSTFTENCSINDIWT